MNSLCKKFSTRTQANHLTVCETKLNSFVIPTTAFFFVSEHHIWREKRDETCRNVKFLDYKVDSSKYLIKSTLIYNYNLFTRQFFFMLEDYKWKKKERNPKIVYNVLWEDRMIKSTRVWVDLPSSIGRQLFKRVEKIVISCKNLKNIHYLVKILVRKFIEPERRK